MGQRKNHENILGKHHRKTFFQKLTVDFKSKEINFITGVDFEKFHNPYLHNCVPAITLIIWQPNHLKIQILVNGSLLLYYNLKRFPLPQ